VSVHERSLSRTGGLLVRGDRLLAQFDEELSRRRSGALAKRGGSRGECIWFGSLYVRILSLWTLVDSEDVSSRRFAAAGAALAGGLVFGFVLSTLFRWSPYYWQWLAYHNGLVAAVITYLLVWASDESPRRRRIRRPAPEVRIRAAEAADVESIL